MFLVSKLVWMILQPLSLVFLAGIFALVLLWFRCLRLAMALLSVSLLILFVTLYTSVGALWLQGLEQRFPRPAADPASIACMIVLGGAFETEVTTTRGGIEFNQSADRFVEALRLAMRFPEARILVSGGDGSLSGRYEGDAAASGRFFTSMGIDASRLMAETASRNTDENVSNTREILARVGLTDCLLITSAFHMPRSMGLFRKAGVDVVPWPTDFRTTGHVELAIDLTQPTSNAQLTATAAREWLGLIAYRLLGRIDSFFPGP